MSEDLEATFQPETEKPRGREIVVFFVRHGEADYAGHGDKEGWLTEKGKEQARETARKLLAEIKDGEAIKFYTSPLRRSRETAQILRETMTDELTKADKKVSILQGESRTKEGLTSIDILTDDYWRLRSEGIRNPVQYWLTHPTERPEEAIQTFTEMVKYFQQLASRISPEGPKINLICITHGGNPELFLAKATGKTEVADLANGEVVKVTIPQKTTLPIEVDFREEKFNV